MALPDERHPLYFEDFSVGDVIQGGEAYVVTKEDIIEFAEKWDPHPFHTNEESARSSIFKGLAAPAAMIVAIAGWLWHRADRKPCLVAGLGWDEVRFLEPVRPGDILSIKYECTDARPSSGRRDCGVICTEVTVTNQRGVRVLTLRDGYLVKKRET